MLSWTPVLIYRQQHRPIAGELDLGGAGLASITIFLTGVFLICGLTALVHASVSFLWRKLRARRHAKAIVSVQRPSTGS
jgi:hypothetical protein